MRVVLGIGGGIAAYKAALLLRLFTEAGHEVVAMPTSSALEFIGAPTMEALSGQPVRTSVFDDVESVNHVRQGERADLVVVAPATADLLARAASGRADDLLTATLLTATCPVVFAPAMHTQMWENPATQRNIRTLREDGRHIIEPATGRLTGKGSGIGRLPEPQEIFEQALRIHAEATAEPAAEATAESPTTDRANGPLAGRRVLISTGGTREALDPVRYLGNRSSGRQGLAIARAALAAGAEVTLVCGHLEIPVPQEEPGLSVHEISSALQLREKMHELVERERPDVVVMAAAVADFRPAAYAETKIKKDPEVQDAPVIDLVRNPDILRGLVEAREQEGGRHLIVGFAAETGSPEATVEQLGREKLLRKGADLLVVNEVGAEKVFGRDDTEASILWRTAEGEILEERVAGSKELLAQALIRHLGSSDDTVEPGLHTGSAARRDG